MMDLVLEFKNGTMTGEGADGIGFFTIAGNYSTQSGECNWVKQYVGRHAVRYQGFQEGKGIWGNWTLTLFKGGFHIWPLSEAPPLEASEETEDNVEPALAELIGGRASSVLIIPPRGCFPAGFGSQKPCATFLRNRATPCI
jgi:hypothetical protein